MLASLEVQLNTMSEELEKLSGEAQKAKESHFVLDAQHRTMLERLHYIGAIQQLTVDVERFKAQVSRLDASRAVMGLKDVLTSLKANLSHIYTTARSHSTLLDPIGRSTFRTWETTRSTRLQSPMKRDTATSGPETLGMRLLLPPDTIKTIVALVEQISQQCSTIANKWLEEPENMTYMSKIASALAVQLSDASLGRIPSSGSPLFHEIATVDLQFAQQLFWLCRTTQELKTMLIGPPNQHSINTGSPRFFSPRKSSQTDPKKALAFIHSYGAASTLFDKYWIQSLEPIVAERFRELPSPNVFTPETIDAYLQEVNGVVSRVWIITKMLWFDTPSITAQLVARGVSSLEAYLDLRLIHPSDTELKLELPIHVPNLTVFSLPHVQLEAISLRWAGTVDRILLPLYESFSDQFASVTLEDAVECLTRLRLFWGNATSGPWYALAQGGFSPSVLVLRFMPMIQSLRQATLACTSVIESAPVHDKTAFLDAEIWANPGTSASKWFHFLITCVTMLISCPGQLAVEDFLLESLSTPLTKSNPDAYKAVWTIISAGLDTPSSLFQYEEDSLWSLQAIIGVLENLKLGSLMMVLKRRLRDMILLKPNSESPSTQ
jgi:hypothetical protein